jgi:hypothetical protein
MVYPRRPAGSHGLLQLILICCALLCVAWSGPAQARRVALIVGNSHYNQAAFLPNPDADARLVATSARRAGFEVTLLSDLSRAAFDEALRRFRAQADGAEVAMIYYAGHGIESGGKNWVIPTDAILREVRDLRFEAIELDGLLETLDGAKLRIVVLDACRNNPFGNNWRASARSVPKGLAETDVEGALVMFAASGGEVATDGTGGNSPFARSLARRMAQPGLSIRNLGSTVRADVVADTGGKQTPFTSMSIPANDVYLVNGGGDASGNNPGSALADAGSGGGDAQSRGITRQAFISVGSGLPLLPTAPLFPSTPYPNCREDYQRIPSARNRIVSINQCIGQLDAYSAGVLKGYTQTMTGYQTKLTQLYDGQVRNQPQYTPAQQEQFQRAMQREHDESGPDGAYFTQYRASQSRYEADRAYLRQRYCAYSGTCSGR